MNATPRLFGVMGQFETPKAILNATRLTYRAGYRSFDAYTPYPIEGLALELGQRGSRVPFVVLMGGITGAAVGFFMQYWSMAVDYPYNSGGRPFNSWPVFVPIAFEMLILVASFAAFLGMLFLNGLPRPHHPLFNVPSFARASQDRFFLCIEASDPRFDLVGVTEFLGSLAECVEVVEVPFEDRPKEAEPEFVSEKQVAISS